MHPSPRTGFCFWDALIDELVDRGIPRDEIVTSRSEMATPIKEKRAHDDLRAGRKRVALFSTAKGGTGLNVQRRLVALHNVDACWRPCDQEQRIGRILRTGNIIFPTGEAGCECPGTRKYGGVRVKQWVTVNSLEARIYGLLQQKAAFISSVMKADIDHRQIDDISAGALSFAEIKSVVMGEPAIMAEAEINGLIRKLTTLKSMHEGQQWRLGARKVELARLIASERQRTILLGMDRARLEASADAPTMIQGIPLGGLKEPGKAMDRAVLDAKINGGGTVATIRGFKISAVMDPQTKEWTLEADGAFASSIEVGRSLGGQLLNRAEALIDSIPKRLEGAEERLERYEAELEEVTVKIGAGFEHDRMIESLRTIHDVIATELAAHPDRRDRIALDTALDDFKRLKAATEQAEKSAARKRDVAKSAIEQIMEAAREKEPEAGEFVDADSADAPEADAAQPSDQPEAAEAIHDAPLTPPVSMAQALAERARRKGRARMDDPRQGWLFPEVA